MSIEIHQDVQQADPIRIQTEEEWDARRAKLDVFRNSDSSALNKAIARKAERDAERKAIAQETEFAANLALVQNAVAALQAPLESSFVLPKGVISSDPDQNTGVGESEDFLSKAAPHLNLFGGIAGAFAGGVAAQAIDQAAREQMKPDNAVVQSVLIAPPTYDNGRQIQPESQPDSKNQNPEQREMNEANLPFALYSTYLSNVTTPDGTIDEVALEQNLEYQIASGLMNAMAIRLRQNPQYSLGTFSKYYYFADKEDGTQVLIPVLRFNGEGSNIANSAYMYDAINKNIIQIQPTNPNDDETSPLDQFNVSQDFAVNFGPTDEYGVDRAYATVNINGDGVDRIIFGDGRIDGTNYRFNLIDLIPDDPNGLPSGPDSGIKAENLQLVKTGPDQPATSKGVTATEAVMDLNTILDNPNLMLSPDFTAHYANNGNTLVLNGQEIPLRFSTRSRTPDQVGKDIIDEDLVAYGIVGTFLGVTGVRNLGLQCLGTNCIENLTVVDVVMLTETNGQEFIIRGSLPAHNVAAQTFGQGDTTNYENITDVFDTMLMRGVKLKFRITSIEGTQNLREDLSRAIFDYRPSGIIEQENIYPLVAAVHLASQNQVENLQALQSGSFDQLPGHDLNFGVISNIIVDGTTIPQGN